MNFLFWMAYFQGRLLLVSGRDSLQTPQVARLETPSLEHLAISFQHLQQKIGWATQDMTPKRYGEIRVGVGVGDVVVFFWKKLCVFF